MIRRDWLLVPMVFVVLLVAVPVCAAVSPELRLELSHYAAIYGGEVFQTPNDGEQTLWFRINDGGTNATYTAVSSTYYNEALSGVGHIQLLQQFIQPGGTYTASQWYQFGNIKLTGSYQTLFYMDIDLNVVESSDMLISNPVYGQVVPETGTVGVFGLGLGLLGAGGFVYRRRPAALIL